MSEYKDIYVRKVFSAEALTTSGTATSTILDLGSKVQNGFFGCHYTKTGSGVVKVEYELSDDYKGTFLTPSTAVDIVSAIAAGTQSDIVSFEPEVARFMKITLTEDGTNTAVITMWIAID